MTYCSLTCPARTGGAFPAILTMSHTITETSPERHLSAKQRSALEILAAAGQRGCTGATLLAHGFSVEMLADLVHGGLATAQRQTMRSEEHTSELQSHLNLVCRLLLEKKKRVQTGSTTLHKPEQRRRLHTS